MDISIYRSEQWHDFFLMVGGGAAALAGLVFVALSINLGVIAEDMTHRYRAMGTLTGFTAVFMICSFGLLGNQNHHSVGVEWLVISAIATVVYVNGYIKAIRSGESTVGLQMGRLVGGTACYAAQIVGSIMLISGFTSGLYVAASAMVVSFASLISGAWLLIVGIHQSQDERK